MCDFPNDNFGGWHQIPNDGAVLLTEVQWVQATVSSHLSSKSRTKSFAMPTLNTILCLCPQPLTETHTSIPTHAPNICHPIFPPPSSSFIILT